jgi:hypothetical protein
VRRIVHEIVVRSCHLIAAPRGAMTKEAAPETTEESVVPETRKGENDHDEWPVG